MKVIVTGGTGFIGSNLVDKLIINGYEVHVIDNFSTGSSKFLNPKANYYLESISDYEKMKEIFERVQPKVIFHLAAQTDVQNSIKNPVHDAQVNIISSLNIIELCKSYNCKLIYSSSAAVYGSPKTMPISEIHPISPLSNYGISKFAPELYIRSYADLYNLKYSILRYANVYGPRQQSNGEGGVISIFINKMIKNETPTVFGNGEQTRDFIFVEDVVSANIAASNSDKNGTYNISTNMPLSVNSLISHLNNILNKNIKPIYSTERPGDILDSCLNNEFALNELKWKPNYSIIEGLEKTCDFYLNN